MNRFLILASLALASKASAQCAGGVCRPQAMPSYPAAASFAPVQPCQPQSYPGFNPYFQTAPPPVACQPFQGYYGSPFPTFANLRSSPFQPFRGCPQGQCVGGQCGAGGCATGNCSGGSCGIQAFGGASRCGPGGCH